MTETATATFPASEAAIKELSFHSGKVLVHGEFRDPLSGKTTDQVFPGTGQVVGKVALADENDVNAAVESANKAQPGWADMNARDRRRVLLAFARLIDENKDELARLQTLDAGIAMQMSAGWPLGPEMTSDFLEFYAGTVDKEQGEILPTYPAPALNYTLREPLGVVACITAWNAPLYLFGAKVAPALACGNTVVVKPSEIGTASTLRLGELALQAGIPKGVINIISGLGPDCAEPLIKHDGIDAVSFTGSVTVGRRVAALAAETPKRVVLEMGGKSANIVFDDAEMSAAGSLSAGMVAYGLSGQGCACATRAIVQKSAMDDFLNTAVATMGFMQPGDPFDPMSMTGPVISERQLQRIQGFVDKGQEEGAELKLGGGRLDNLTPGFYFAPTLLFGTNDMTPMREEIFGPVLSVIPFETEDEAVRIANDSPYGLGGVITTNNLTRAHRVAKALKTGTIGINGYSVGSTTPFGGVKQSGYGREGSAHALNDYSYIKSVYIDLK
jgi:aldehyde dehydrogenase (NAD+)